MAQALDHTTPEPLPASRAALPREVVLADSATQLDGGARGRVVLCGSHGGRFSALCALAAGVLGVVLNDARIGRDRAGVEGLDILDAHGVPAATVDGGSAVIGSADATAMGTLSSVNTAAAGLGVVAGLPALEFVTRVAAVAPRPARAAVASPSESRSLLVDGSVRAWAIDSASLARPQDAGHVLVTGSHAQLVGGAATSALRVAARLAVFNDAGGVVAPSRLEALDQRGIAAVTVAASSARIGDARSTYLDGVISAVNARAAADGAAVSMTVLAYVTDIVGRAPGGTIT